MVEFLTTKEVAALLRIKERTVYDLVKEGSIPVSRVTGTLLFPRELVEAWVRRNAETEGGIETVMRPPPARSELDVAVAVAEGKADAGLGIEAIARQQRLEFKQLFQERYDLVIWRRDYFESPFKHFSDLPRATLSVVVPGRFADTISLV